ncbi:MAG: hypothetical protein HYV18_02960 [Gammaproteobacteria bacterium]|nr:hypothetical protein [Gammaproteobacteria bacterium]
MAPTLRVVCAGLHLHTKSKRMRWRTFERLTAQHDELVGRSVQGMMVKLKLWASTINVHRSGVMGENSAAVLSVPSLWAVSLGVGVSGEKAGIRAGIAGIIWKPTPD